MMRYHVVERTSPKGHPFIGTCRLCGLAGLKADAALEECENVRGLSFEEAVVEVIRTDREGGWNAARMSEVKTE